MYQNAIDLDRVTKRFSGHTAVRSLSLVVPRGGIFGLLGPNGAGKSTTIRMIMSIILPDEGKVTLFGGEQASRDLSTRIGYLPEERGLYRKMFVGDQLAFLGEIKGVPRARARELSKQWLARLGLADWARRRVEDLSKGMQQKVQFIGSILHEPELVILDEPFGGLDPVNSKVMRDVVVEIARNGGTVLLSTHIMEQAEKMCDRVAIIVRGEKVVDGKLADVKHGAGGRHVALAFHRNQDAAARVLSDRTLVSRVDDYGATAEAQLVEGVGSDRLLAALVGSGAGVSRFEVVEPSLHSIFVAKVGVEAASAPAQEDA
jgi:ABC-2 type transport system ATP-binding protein